MINQEEFVFRLKKVMEYYSETAASFSEKIGVQRSSISHILSGRNKPSLEFIQKVLAQFPKVSADWLISGKTAVIANNINLPEQQTTPPKETNSPTLHQTNQNAKTDTVVCEKHLILGAQANQVRRSSQGEICLYWKFRKVLAHLNGSQGQRDRKRRIAYGDKTTACL